MSLRLSKMRIVSAVVLASILMWDILVGSSFFSMHWLIQGSSSQIALANPPPPPPGTLTITCLGNAGRVTATWTDAQGPHTQVFTKTLQGGNDFPATLNFPGSASVTLDASDQDGWSHVCWEHTTNGQLYHESEEEITVSVVGSVTRTVLFMRAELEVYDGAGGAVVAEADESTRGAFSAANVNDTDNNQMVDNVQTTVPGEKDLIKIVLKMPEPSGKVAEHNGVCAVSVSGGPDCKLWLQSTKGTEFTGTINISSLPLTLWVEGRAASGSLRDVSIGYMYMVGFFHGPADGAKATFLNVNVSATDLFRTVPEAQEESIGAFIHQNLDNDDGNPPDNSPDKTQDGPITGEDDLKRAYASVSPLPNVGVVAMKTGAGMKIYKNAIKGATNLLVDAGGEKTWDLMNANERTQYTADIANLFVEGTADGSSNLSLEYRLPTVLDDKVKYTFVAALCGDQPTPLRSSGLKTDFPGLIHCEWSITAPPNGVYNCIAWSVGETNVWYNPISSVPPIIVGIDEAFGNNDLQLQDADMDAFYSTKKGYTPTATSAADAEVMYYSKFHGAARKGCGCMQVPTTVCSSGKYMFESKCGNAERIEHVHDQLSGTTYGSPVRFYK